MAENEQFYSNRVLINVTKQFVKVKVTPVMIVIIVFKPD